MPPIAARVPHRGSGVLAQKVEQDNATVVLLDPRSGEYYALEAVGARVWELCDGARTVRAIATLICAEYDEQQDVIEQDVGALLEELADESLVVLV